MASYSSYDDYIKRLKRKNEPRSYSAFAREELAEAKDEYQSSLGTAMADAARAEPTYGIKAEKLAGAGLNSGGYKEYLSELAKAGLKDARQRAEKKYREAEGEVRASYADYIDKYTKNQEKLFVEVVSDLTDTTLTDYDTMLEYASTSGLSEAYARRAADSAMSAVTEKLRKSVLSAINKDGYSEAESYEYALKLGLSESSARELADYAKKMNGIKLDGSYLEGLKNKN